MMTHKHGMKTILFSVLLGLAVSQAAYAAASLATTTTTITLSTGSSVTAYKLASDGTSYYGACNGNGNCCTTSTNGACTSNTAGFQSWTGYLHTNSAQTYAYYIPASPALAGSASSPIFTPIGLADDFGVALDGIPFDPLTSTCGSTAHSTSNACTFRLEGRLQTTPGTFSSAYTQGRLGFDTHNGHNQSNGAYHYHGIPCGLSQGGTTIVSCDPMSTLSYTTGAWGSLPSSATVVGYARDGYPIVVQAGVYASYSPVTSATSGRPSTTTYSTYGNYSMDLSTLVTSGSTFTMPSSKTMADFTYTGPSTLGTSTTALGLCNEAPNTSSSITTLGGATAAYVYYLTPNFPMVPRCLIGVTDGNTGTAQGFYHYSGTTSMD